MTEIPTVRALVPRPAPGVQDAALDIETEMVADWDNPGPTPLLFVWTFDASEGLHMWRTRTLAALSTYLHDKRIVTWNGERFDLPVLRAKGVGNPAGSLDLMALIQTHTRCRYRLAEVAEANFGRGKVATAQLAVEMWQSGNPDLQRQALDYCIEDVRLTWGLYQRALRRAILLPPKSNSYGNHPEMLFQVRAVDPLPHASEVETLMGATG